MALWTCPHCGAAQAASARCWVCHRSSTTCSTCRHFRTSLAADVGWCALDRRRRPLTGLELRGCWTQGPSTAAPSEEAASGAGFVPDPAWRQLPVRGFVPVDAGPPRNPTEQTAPAAPFEVPRAAVDPPEGWDGRVSLFGDLER